MESRWTLLIIIVAATALHAYKACQSSGISGRVSPQNAGEVIWAIQGSDSIKAIPENGVFTMEAKPGIYKLFVDAKHPFKHLLVESVEVTSGKTSDLGQLKMIQ